MLKSCHSPFNLFFPYFQSSGGSKYLQVKSTLYFPYSYDFFYDSIISIRYLLASPRFKNIFPSLLSNFPQLFKVLVTSATLK